jgi:colicin import membrane protein
MTEAASMPPAPAPVPDPQPQATPQPEPQVIPAQDVHAAKQDIEKHALRQADAEKRAELGEQRKKAEDRERRHRRYAERKARREAARQQLQEAQDQQQHEHREVRRTAGQLGILAFDSDDEPPRQSFFGD